MTIKREAAFHEAGHAVAAYRSRFHNIVGTINLEEYGAGEIYVSLSKKKLVAGGKPTDQSAQKDKEVAADLAVVLCSGLVAERMAEKSETGLKANPKCAELDHELASQQLSGAGLSKKFDLHEAAAVRLLEMEWNLVTALADHLFGKVSVDPVEVLAFIESRASAPQ
jgi:hypothetical protein